MIDRRIYPMNKINSKITVKALAAHEAAREKALAIKAIMADKRGSVSEHAIVIIIGVVLGGLLLVGLIALMNNVIMPSTESQVTSMFGMAP